MVSGGRSCYLLDGSSLVGSLFYLRRVATLWFTFFYFHEIQVDHEVVVLVVESVFGGWDRVIVCTSNGGESSHS